MRRNHLIMGSAITLAAIAVAIDHTRHRLPPAEPAVYSQEQGISGETPCSLGNPCALGGEQNPCGLGGYTDSPCSL